MDREGTSQAPSFRSLLLVVSLFHPPSLSLFPSLWFFFSLSLSFLSWQATPSTPLGSLNQNPTAPSLGHKRELHPEMSAAAFTLPPVSPSLHQLSIPIHKYDARPSSLSPPFASCDLPLSRQSPCYNTQVGP